MNGSVEESERLFELCPDLLAVTGFDGYLLKVNRAWTRVLGWSREELLSRPYVEFLHPDDVERTAAAGAELIAGRSVTGFENRYRHLDGGYRWLSWDAEADVAAGRMYAAIRDVTEERRIAAFRDQIETITGIGTWEIDLQTNEVDWSPATHRIHGTDPRTYRPTVDVALDFYPGTARDTLAAAVQRLLDDGTPYDLELPLRRVDGRLSRIRATATAGLRDGQVVEVFGTIQDVTAAVAERDRLRRFSDLLEVTEEGIAEITTEGVIGYANARLARMLGEARAEDLRGRHVLDLLHGPDARAALAQAEGRLAAGDTVLRGEIRLLAADGLLWTQAAASIPAAGAEGGTSITVVFTDIHALKQREEELEEARAQLEEAQVLARIGHWRADIASGEMVASPVVQDIVLEQAGELDLATYLAAVHPDDRPRLPQRPADLPTRGTLDIMHRLLVPSGEERTVHLRATSEVDAQGWILALRGTLQDVTALHRTEQALQRVLRATNDGWWEDDLATGTGLYSDRWWELHGLTPRRGRVPAGTWHGYVPEEELPAIEARFEEVVAAREGSFQLDGHITHVSGRKIPVVVRASIEYDRAGRPIRVSGATTDVTEAVEVARAKEVFVSTVSHELRTPLTAVGGAIELLAAGRGGQLEEGGEQLLDIAARNTERLRVLIGDLLDVEQLRLGAVTLQLQPELLSPIIAASIEELQPAASSQQVRLEATLPDEQVAVSCDAARIGQVVANLLSNAVKFAPVSSTVEVHVQPRPEQVRVGIRDRGPGVPESFRERAFERFAQADPDDPRSRGGTGLGLAICQEIVQQHGGRVGYDSRPGDTTFWFELPLVSGGRKVSGGKVTSAG